MLQQVIVKTENRTVLKPLLEAAIEYEKKMVQSGPRIGQLRQVLMAIAIGASYAFLTPVGHQSNTLVMGPGGYKFGDYWRMGLVLEIIVAVVAIPLIMIFWPL